MKDQAEVKPLFPNFALQLRLRIRCIEEDLSLNRDGAVVRRLQKVQAPQQCGLSAAGGTDNGQGLSLLQGEADVIEDLGGVKMLFKMLYFQNGHSAAPLFKVAELSLNQIEENGQNSNEN